MVTRLFCQGQTSTTNTGLNAIAQAVANSWGSNLSPVQVPTVALTSVQVEDLTSPTSPNGIWLGNIPGTLPTTTVAAPQAAFIVRAPVPLRLRGGHTKTYIPGIALSNENSEDANTWTTGFGSSMTTRWNSLLQNICSALATNGMGTANMVSPAYYRGGRTWVHYGTAPYDWYKKKNNIAPLPIQVIQYGNNATGYNPTIGTQRRRTRQSA
jgi:hypothetical protein